MKAQTIISVKVVPGFLSIALACGMPQMGHAAEVCPTNSSGPDICVNRDGPDPVLDIDFTVDYTTDPANPSVTLKTGSLTWNVRSRVGPPPNDTPANMGTISIDPTAVDDFEVSILDGTGPGAINVGGMILDPSDAGNFSNLSGAKITGTLSGLFLQRSSGGVGGNVTGALTIETIGGSVLIYGDVLAPMTVSTVESGVTVTIKGNLGTPSLSADLNITTLLAGVINIAGTATNYGDITVESLSGNLLIGGTVPSGNTVTIQNMEITETSSGHVNMGTLAGRLELMNGIPSSCPVAGPCPDGSLFVDVLVSDLTGTGVIDLNGADVAGTLSVTKGHNNSRIIAGGAVSGFIYPGFSLGNFFNGTLTVSSVSEIGTLPTVPTGEIETFLGAALNGTVNVTNANAGLVEASGPFTGQINVGSVASTGVIETAQTASGNIVVSGACAGAIVIEGDLTGTVDIGSISGGTLTSSGSVTVEGALKAVGLIRGKILVDGICDGPIEIGQQTDDGTLIHLVNGLDAGRIEINTSGGTFDADGDIRVDPAGVLTNIVFDGCIHIYEGLIAAER